MEQGTMNNSIKKICGENLGKFIELNFNPYHILPIIKKHFNNDGQDIRYVKESEWDKLKVFFNSIDNEKEKVKVKKSPHELLKEKGYTLYRCPTFKDFNKFKKYYRKDELLCKFNDSNRADNYHVFWIVKDNAKEIKPQQTPERQDEYGTSVCSISVTKDGRNVAQICNRYNHKVKGCDNTFNSNLDNITIGLTESFNKEFGFKLNAKNNTCEFENFTLFDNKFVYYFSEINGNKIGNYTIVSDRIINFDKNHYFQWDNMFIDLRSCKVYWDKNIYGYEDDFVRYFNSTVKKIVFVKNLDEVDDNGSDEIVYIDKSK